jgi:hypothetical protein
LVVVALVMVLLGLVWWGAPADDAPRAATDGTASRVGIATQPAQESDAPSSSPRSRPRVARGEESPTASSEDAVSKPPDDAVTVRVRDDTGVPVPGVGLVLTARDDPRESS